MNRVVDQVLIKYNKLMHIGADENIIVGEQFIGEEVERIMVNQNYVRIVLKDTTNYEIQRSIIAILAYKYNFGE